MEEFQREKERELQKSAEGNWSVHACEDTTEAGKELPERREWNNTWRSCRAKKSSC